MKAKVMSSSASGVVGNVCESIAHELKCKCDMIPPAYPCDKEVVVFFGISGIFGLVSPKTIKYISSINKTGTKNVAFLCTLSSKPAVSKLSAVLKNNGVNIIEDSFVCKAGLFTGKKEAARGVDWVKTVVDRLTQ